MKRIKREQEEIEEPKLKKIKLEPEESFLITYDKEPKIPKTQKILREVKESHRHKAIVSDHQCDICQKYYVSKSNLNIHKKRHFDEKVQPELKQEVMRTEVNKTSHRIIPFSDHQCEICFKFYSTKESLKSHRKLHFKSTEAKCEKCNKKFTSKYNFEIHSCSSTCTICSTSFTTVNRLKIHMKLTHKMQMFTDGFVCDYCSENFKSKGLLKIHILKRACGGQRKFSCDHCGKSLTKKEDFRAHILSHAVHKVECGICLAKIKPRALEIHMRNFHPKVEETFKCQICLKSFKSSQILKRHQKNHDKKFQCTRCPLKFADKSIFNAHQKFHDNPEQFRCKICDKQKTSKSSLTVHMKTHGQREMKFKCNRCDYKSDYKGNLVQHLKFHERDDEKLKNSSAVKCEKCARVFTNRQRAMDHFRRQHGNYKKYQCDCCDYENISKQNFRRHFVRKHLNKK